MPFAVKAKSRGGEGDLEWSARVGVAGPTALEILQSQDIPIRSSCMGKGLCHQCRVKVERGLAPISASDRKAFPEGALKEGWRLSCMLRPKANLELFFPQVYVFQEDLQVLRSPQGPWWIAVDLGTTGVELAAVDEQGLWAKVKSLNRQIQMGADVMTRLEYAQRRGVEPLRQRAVGQLRSLVKVLETTLKKSSEKASQPGSAEFTGRIVVAGNSAVISFLLGLNIESLAVSPYQPEVLTAQVRELPQAAEASAWQLETLPLIDSFVGGDLWAGLFLLHQRGLATAEHSWILVDVGTNSEILFWDGQKLFVSSTPAGPAFEGSSISIGMRAESGAIVNPRWNPAHQRWDYEVIDGDYPKGLCGSSLVQMVAEAVTAGSVNREGEVLEPVHLELSQGLALSQADVREFQLAKSAIRTGLELVVEKVSATGKPPEKLFLAGAFGQHLPLQPCFDLDLLPLMEVEILGNSSLEGTVAWGQATDQQRDQFSAWVEKTKTPIELALSDDFQEKFIRNMYLGQL